MLKAALFFGVGFVILYLVYRSQNKAYQAQCALDGVPAESCSLIQKVLEDFASANYFWILMVLVAFTVSNISRSVRWIMLIRPLGYEPRPINAFLTIMLGYFTNLGLPRVGEVIRAGSLANYEKIGVEKTMGTVVVDRMTDMATMLLAVGLAFILEFDKILELIGSLTSGGESKTSLLRHPLVIGLAITGLLGLLLLYLFRKQLQKLKIYKKLENLLIGFWEGLKTILKLRSPFWYIFHSLNIWLMYYLMTYFGFLAFAPTAHLGLLPALLIFVIGAFGILVPSPGGMGTYHLLVVAGLTGLYAIGNADAFSFANILFFSIQIGCNVLFGIIALIALPVINRDYHPIDGPEVTAANSTVEA